MTDVVDGGLSLVHATGQRVRDAVDAMAPGARGEADADPRDGEPRAQQREKSAFQTRMVELAASAVGALAAFFVSRLVRVRVGRRGK
jgi:hypothetical protein